MSEVLAPGGISLGTDQSFVPRCAPFLSDMNTDAVALEGTSGKLPSPPVALDVKDKASLHFSFLLVERRGLSCRMRSHIIMGFPLPFPAEGIHSQGPFL